jgi:hypothetical protein
VAVVVVDSLGVQVVVEVVDWVGRITFQSHQVNHIWL